MGGKSRKSGGVSKKLIAHIKNNSGKSSGKKCCGTKPKQPSKGIFDGDE